MAPEFLTMPDYGSANDLAVQLTKETGIPHVVKISHYLYIVEPRSLVAMVNNDSSRSPHA